MGPCAVCGGGTIDAAGNCTQCGNYRGTGEATSAPPANYPPPGYPQQPQSAYPSPTSGSGYDTYPTSGAAGYPTSGGAGYPTSGGVGYPTSGGAGYPSSGGAGYPSSGGGYPSSPPPPPPAYQPPPQYTAQPQAYPPVYTPPPPQNKGRRGLNILIAALVSVVLVLLCCIGIAVWGNTEDEPDPNATGTPTPAVSVNPDIDACTVGTWNVSTHTEDLEVPNVGTIKLSGGKGATFTLAEDGTAVFDYGTGTEYTGTLSGQNVRLRIQGEVTYDYTSRNSRLALTGVDTEATFVIFVNGEETSEEQEFLASSDTADYTCSSTRLTQKGNAYTIEYTRG
ncbi:hypothetical protein J2S43_007028 [Catenuloplanes nepalensis]|uniref:Uncharacterized protein n=1 Tax=Catenuloplanes nepalensis TaxID=587533 RepID=A0ABT9N5J5_9ACTN|nr:hypothetical protein [Catenuloplanes nepalensis]MDP9798516.1 hypothetical protein [Catenuloplanes nepalensis]